MTTKREDCYIKAGNVRAYRFLVGMGYTMKKGMRVVYRDGAYDSYYGDDGGATADEVYYCVDFKGSSRDFHRLLRDNHLLL